MRNTANLTIRTGRDLTLAGLDKEIQKQPFLRRDRAPTAQRKAPQSASAANLPDLPVDRNDFNYLYKRAQEQEELEKINPEWSGVAMHDPRANLAEKMT